MVLAIGASKPRKRGTRGKRKHKASTESVNAIGDVEGSDTSDWILDSVLSRHLVNDASIMQVAKVCDQEISMADGEFLKITHVISVRLRVFANGKDQTITPTDVYLAPQLARNIVYFIRETRAEWF